MYVKEVGGGCGIEFAFAESESEVEIGQFGREGQKQRSFGVKLTGEGGIQEGGGE